MRPLYLTGNRQPYSVRQTGGARPGSRHRTRPRPRDSLAGESYVQLPRGLDVVETAHGHRVRRVLVGLPVLPGVLDDGDERRFTGDIDFAGNRFGAFGTYYHDRAGNGDTATNSFIEFDTALAWADGVFAVGNQVRNRGFAIVTPVQEEDDRRDIFVDDWGGSDYRARSGLFGPALVSDLVPYTNNRIEISPRDGESSEESGVVVISDSYRIESVYALPHAGVVVRPDTEDKAPATEQPPREEILEN